MSFPILLATDCSEYPPENLVKKLVSENLIQYLKQHPDVPSKALLWNRLLLTTIPMQIDPSGRHQFGYEENFSFEPPITGNIFSYCSVDHKENNLVLCLSKLPISVTSFHMNLSQEQIGQIRKTFSAPINAWIDRQENSVFAFYQYLTSQAVIEKKNQALLELRISDEDSLDVSYPSIYLKQTLTFWQHNDWIYTILGMMLHPLLTEYRTTEKTIKMLKNLLGTSA
ncbi:MAG: hypothetical protein IJ022_05805 [Burkholderiaceae bacterium]|nr:hypothetical protein [Burkholderiaceae bacterium]